METLNEYAKNAFFNSQSHGFWDDEPKEMDQAAIYLSNKLMLIVGEVAEAHEELRKNIDPYHTYRRDDGKPEGFAYELVDVLIRVFDLAGALDLDLDTLVLDKAAYNATRAPKHGKNF